MGARLPNPWPTWRAVTPQLSLTIEPSTSQLLPMSHASIARGILPDSGREKAAARRETCPPARFASDDPHAATRTLHRRCDQAGRRAQQARRRACRPGWRSTAGTHRTIQHVAFGANWWKSFVMSRLAVAIGDPGALTLFGPKPDAYRLLAAHLTAEYRVCTEGRGRKLRPDGGDNQWLDWVVGAAVAASIEGVLVVGHEPPRSRRRHVRMSDVQRGPR